jgi:hypothetical protein
MFARSGWLWMVLLLLVGGIVYGWYRYELDGACKRRCSSSSGHGRFVGHKVKHDGWKPACFCVDVKDHEYLQEGVEVF